MIENRNLILAVVLSVAILLASDFFFKLTRPAPPPGTEGKTEQELPKQPSRQTQTSNIPSPAKTDQTPEAASTIPSPPGSALQRETSKAREAAIATGGRIKIDTPRLRGSIALRGGIIDDLLLTNYRETLDPKSDEIVIFMPKGMNNAYYAQFGWVSSENFARPNEDTIWHSTADVMSPNKPVILSWNNGDGLTFKRTYAIDDNYMFTVTQKIINSDTKAKTLSAYGLVSRRGTPETTGFYILHEGLLGL